MIGSQGFTGKRADVPSGGEPRDRGDLRPVIVLLGPTGVGKTEASICVARELGTEIISADSMQVYRHMDVGTAKPSRELLAAVKHHMIDVADPAVPFSTGKYLGLVVPIIETLQGMGKPPLVVGGTGLYIKAMTRGLFSAPAANESLRAELLSIEQERHGILYERLKGLDPVAAGRIPPGDLRRILRALEVSITAGSPISVLQHHATRPLPYRFIKIGLTRERSELYRMIGERVEQMFAHGLIEEVEQLLALSPCYTALQAIGYKEVIRFLRGQAGLEETVALVKRSTRRYAKRQYTWFRKEESISWIDITGLSDSDLISREIFRILRRGGLLPA
ncbi:MAG: tRNA (adenosine(37)-N6)-dimethylallyltransferase MiaA [Thermodesulfovibrionales bacterium]